MNDNLPRYRNGQSWPLAHNNGLKQDETGRLYQLEPDGCIRFVPPPKAAQTVVRGRFFPRSPSHPDYNPEEDIPLGLYPAHLQAA